MTESILLLSKDVATEQDVLRQQLAELKLRMKNLEETK